MVFHDKAYVERLRVEYPAGTRIELIYTDDPYTRLRPGDKGEIQYVDDAGTLHADWDSGSALGLVPSVDAFKKLSPQDSVYKTGC